MMKRLLASCSLLLVTLVGSHAAWGQSDPVTFTSPNAKLSGQFGAAVAGVPDVNGDGRGDVLVGAHREDGGEMDDGQAYVFSGSTGALLRTLVSPNPESNGQFGRFVAGVPDADGDGRGDVLVSAITEDGGAASAGRVYLFSGSTGDLLQTLVSPSPEPGGQFGTTVAGVPDTDGDGRGDLLVGAYLEDGGASSAGRAYLFSGATGALLRTLVSPNFETNGFFGFAVAGVEDVDGDGRGDLLVDAGRESGPLNAAGRVYLFSGASGDLIRSLESPNPEDSGFFGNALAGVPDVDGDGRGDLLIGASEEDGGAPEAGRAYVYSGATGMLLNTLQSPSPQNLGLFGGSVAGVPDADGDGRGDLLIGARFESGGDTEAGRVYLFSGASGDLIRTLVSQNPEVSGQFGVSVAGVADADGDEQGDLLVGAALEDGGAEDAGRAYLFLSGEGGGNMPPIAVDDMAATTEGVAVSISVLSNDADPDGDQLTIASVGAPMNGMAEALQGQITYTPSSGFTGTDSFTYTVSDGNGGTDDGLVTVAVSNALDILTLVSPNPEALGNFGVSAAGVPDLNGDGRGDVLVGAWREDGGAGDAGRAHVFSGVTGARLRTLVSPNPEIDSQFGRSVAGVPDADGDGQGDLLVGAPLEDGGASNAGRAYLFSGATGVVLRTLVSPNPEANGVFGLTVAGVPDLDGDGRGDLFVGAQGEDGGMSDAGRAYVFSGATGELLRTLVSPNPEANGFFGFDVAGVPDLDGDGQGDFLVAADGEDGGMQDAGRAYVFSGATGALLRTLESPNPEGGGQFGSSVAGVPDADGDGRGDLLVGALFEPIGQLDAGRAYLFSGATGELLRTLESPSPEDGSLFGISVAGVADADGDGRGDLLVGVRSEDGGERDAGRVYLFSGATGALLRTLESLNPTVTGNFGISVAGVPDADGDGRGDFVVGAHREDGGDVGAGRAYLFLSGEEVGNMPPLAVDDAATTTAGAAVTIDVLANDSDPDGDLLTIAMVGSPVNGTAEIVQGQVLYTPGLGFTGIDDFTYTVSDGNGGDDDGFVTVTVLQAVQGLATLTSPNVENLGQFGRSVARVPDADGDGRDDLLVGAPLEDIELPDAGRAYLFSGATGRLLQTLDTPNPEESGFFGFTVAGVPDSDGDGRGDLLIGAILEDNEAQDAGRAYLFSGATGMLLQTLESPNFVQGGSFSAAMAGVPDADGDGRGDLLVGAPLENRGAENAGAAYLYSGATGLLVRTLESPNPELDGEFGVSVSGVSDVNGDGRVDLLVGASREDGGATDAGRVYVFNGTTGALLQTLVSPNPELDGQFGSAIAGVSDANGDGRGDVLIGSPSEDGGAENAGRAHLYSGSTGLLIRTLTSPNPELGGAFGISVSGVLDVDGDEQDDVLVGAFLEDALAMDAGRAYLFGGATGGVLRTLESPNSQAQGFFGDTVVGVSDVDDDGRGDLFISAPFEDPGEVVDAGRAYLFSGSTGGGEIVVTIDFPAAPMAGSDLTLSVSVEGFSATSAELRYRPTGAAMFGTMPLAMQIDSYAGTIPGADVTLRGLDYYIVLTDGETAVTFPTESPELNPLRLRVGVAQQASAVAIPADASSVNSYRMVSVPLVLDDPSPLAVFRDDFGDYGPTSWRLLRYRPLTVSTGSYAEFPELGADIVPGAGFWLAAYSEDTAPFDVENGLSVDASEPALITLEPGWSQIGNPFAFPVAWADVLGSELVQPPASFDGAEYVLGETVLDPWVGYFVLNDTEEPVTLQVPPTEVGQTAARGESKGEEGYRLHLRADVRELDLRDTQNVFGFAEGAADEGAAERDRLDLAEPPPITSHLRLSAVEDGVRLGHSFRPTGTDGADWELEITASPDVLAAGPLSVRVALDEVGGRPDGYDVYVLDLDAEAPLTLLEGAFDVTLSAERPVRRLRLIAGTEAYADAAREGISLLPVTFALAPAYPNPFAGAATLAYELPERADVTLDVFDLLGRRVAVLADGVQEAGRYTVRWDGTTGAGAPAANGVYVYRLRAGGFNASHKVVLLR